MYVPNNRASKYMRQKLTELQREIDDSTIIVGDFNMPLFEMDKPAGRKLVRTLLNSTMPLINWI